MAQTILRLPAVKARTGLSRSAIYLLISKGAFPQSVRLSTRAVGWLESEVEDWLQARIDESRKAAARSDEAYAWHVAPRRTK